MTQPIAAGEPLHRILDALEGDAALVPETTRVIRETLPGYDEVPAASLEASIHRNIGLSIRTLRRGAAPDAAQIDEAEELALERRGQGVPLGSVLAGFRLCMTVILGHLQRLAPEHGMPAEEVLAGANLLWALGDAFSTRAVIVHQEQSLAEAVADSGRRSRWIIDAVLTGLPRTELRSGAAAYGLTDREARALKAPRPDHRVDVGRRLRDWATRAGVSVLTTPHGTAEVGMVIGAPAPGVEPEGMTLALGPAGTLESLPESFAAATRVLETALAVGHRGIADLETLSWRMGITASPEATALLQRRHLAPLEAEGEFGQFLLETVRAYLAHGLSIPRAAASIPVHANTLRYRLKRFQELTGADLRDPEDLIEVSWALAAPRVGL
ncbi:PucR family transcriptional regulator [Brachybacterium avium]|uniref:PucR family transcriptional regulator n=1 Tax=Brachybacterium avium TaxID=2017485 RepID=A0A220UCG9_9MICO|nr:helix-turn-helix domain-containing protein [Brachybacterium avium]ASK65710.1 PucR family transcriptional regulator [Brachybacterium avium]